jgi:uncharacterized membrane protein YeaQ/YmgE (transglycosylase-associated protein family)
MNICLPAKLFFIATIIIYTWFYIYFKNVFEDNKKLFFIEVSIDVLVIVFGTWLLNHLCKANNKNVSWFIFITYLIGSIIIMYIMKQNKFYFDVTRNTTIIV